MPATQVDSIGTLVPLTPDKMTNSISAADKNAVTDALITSVVALDAAARKINIPASLQVEHSPISNGHGERLSIILDMPTPVWDTDTFDRLHRRISFQDWAPIDFDQFSQVWMSKRFLPIAGHKPFTQAV